MPKVRKNYYKKTVGSVAVLGYYVIVPFYNPTALLSNLQKTTANAEEVINMVIQSACKEIQAGLIENGKLYDDGIVEAKVIVEETHVAIYLKLPATVSIHSAVSQIRIHTSAFLERSALSWYRDIYRSLFKTVYLALCAPVDPGLVGCIKESVYNDYLKVFFLENKLKGSPTSLHVQRRNKFGRVKDFMSDDVTYYV